MKVLFLSTHLNVGGITTYILALGKYLKQKGVDVVCASAGGTLVNDLENCGIKHYEIPIRTKSEVSPKLILSFFKILEIIDAEEITHVHAHTRVTQVLSEFVRKFRNVHLITTCHGFHKPKLSRKIFPAWGDRVIAISDPVREHLVNDFKVKKSMISLVYNGVEPDKFEVNLSPFDKEELRRYYKIGEEGLVVGGVSRLTKMKGYQLLIEAAPYILEKHPKTKFVIVGYGHYEKKLRKLAVKLGVEDKVYFTGKVEDVGVALEMIDIFVLPVIWSEGFGLAVLEAMAAGKPVLASNLGGVYALIKENVNGWLLPPGDVDALAKAICKLMDEPELIKIFGRNSYKIAREEFSMERMADGIIEVYKQVAEEYPAKADDSK